jgi:HAD superfamily hydrolase (TIGR01509 family)
LSAEKFEVMGIFFDLDGTIVDSREAYYEAARIAFQKIGQEPLEREASLEIPRRLERKQPITNIIKGDAQKFLYKYLNAYYSITIEKTKPFPKVKTALEALSGKAKLALITMRAFPRENIIKELEAFGIAKYFTYVMTALDTDKPKPSPEALVKCVEALGIQMCDCIIVGDSISDIKAGKAAGTKTAAVLSGIFSRQELAEENPDLIIKDVTALPAFIK